MPRLGGPTPLRSAACLLLLVALSLPASAGGPPPLHPPGAPHASSGRTLYPALDLRALDPPRRASRPSAGVPGTPTDVGTAPTDQAVNVTWAPPLSNGGANLTGYVVVWTPTGNTTGVANVGPSADHTWVAGLQNGIDYAFQVAARNHLGTGVLSAAVGGVPGTVPGPASNLSAVTGNGTAVINWTAPARTPGYPVELYTVNLSADGRARFINTTDTSIDLADLTIGEANRATVVAINGMGAGPVSSGITFTSYAPPGEPIVDTPVYLSDRNVVVVSWIAPGWTGGAPIDNFTIRWWAPNGQSGVAHDSPASTNWTLINPASGEVYSFVIGAEGRGGSGPNVTVSILVPGSIALAPPTPYAPLVVLGELLLVIAVVFVLMVYRARRKDRRRWRPLPRSGPVAPSRSRPAVPPRPAGPPPVRAPPAPSNRSTTAGPGRTAPPSR